MGAVGALMIVISFLYMRNRLRPITRLANAAQARGRGGGVPYSPSGALSERSLRIRVEDDGPGIPEDLRTEALKPFARLDAVRNQNRGGGVGLGLAIAADIAPAHGGVLRLGRSARLGGLQADIVIGR